jgi:hypothetical protein
MSYIQEAIEVALIFKLPIALRGRPGVGKTSMIEAAANHLNLPCEQLIGSLREPTDFAGLPIIQADGSVALAPPAWAVRAASHTNGSVVFLDELTACSAATQSAALRIIREGVAGEFHLPNHVRFVAAYNDADDAGGIDLLTPMRSRLIHINVEADQDAFIHGLLEGWPSTSGFGFDPNSSLSAEHVARWKNLVVAYLRSRPSLLEVPPPPGSWGSFPTPRTWEMLVTAASAADSLGASHECRNLLIEGTIGASHALEFLSFVDQADLPDPFELLRNPQACSHYFDVQRPDRAMVVLLEVANCVKKQPTIEHWEAAWKIAALAVATGFGDLLAWTYRPVVTSRPADAKVPVEYLEVQKFLATL